MDPHRFDRLVKTFVRSRLTRRAALAAGGSGAAAILGATSRWSAVAQDSAPVASPAAGAGTGLLYVQVFQGGTWTRAPDEPDTYLLTLTGHAAQTLYFSDRPERLVGTIPTHEFLGRPGFAPEDPPNAALVAQTADGGEEVLVVELFDPVYSEDFGAGGRVSVTYRARVLAGEPGEGLRSLAARQGDGAFPETFGPASLFVDAPAGCSDGWVVCKRRECVVDRGCKNHEKGRLGQMPFYWEFGDICCHPRINDKSYWRDRCDAEIAACEGQCSEVSWTPCS